MPTKIALLPSRGVLCITGPDAMKLLQGIVTCDLDKLANTGAAHTGLLSPQGKILFDFFVVPAGHTLLLETDKNSVAALKQRLDMYRLRAKADIADASANYTAAARWRDDDVPLEPLSTGDHAPLVYRDPRHPALGERHLASLESNWHGDLAETEAASAEDYAAHRIALGVPQARLDFELGDTFPHEALYDQTGSVSFKKGCYVGQEVVSRMQHRGTARKRVVPVVAETPLPPAGAPIRAGEQDIGKLGSTAGTRGLALIRLDRAAELGAKGATLAAGDTPVRIALPDWVTFPLVPAGSSSAS